MKFVRLWETNWESKCRTPRGVRGLKLTWARMWITVLPSHPSRGAWIEILRDKLIPPVCNVAPLAGCVD